MGIGPDFSTIRKSRARGWERRQH